MTQEERDILIADLCGRLPYGLIIKCNDGFRQSKEKLVSIDVGNGLINYDWRLTDIKPYLRPMSSMTEDEKSIYLTLRTHAGAFTCVEWLDKNHFDHRTDMDGEHLIQLHLALEAKEGMYNDKTK